MHPAYSVIFFTVFSGVGLGLLALLGLAPLFGLAPTGAFGWTGFILAFGLTVGGLISSTQHLGHPERAWRAFTQWRSSWLSREGVLAVATLGVGGLYAIGALFLQTASTALGLATAALALATVYATAMIYGQLRTVQRWNHSLTPACYLTFALAGGLLVFAWTGAATGVLATVGQTGPLASLALVGAWALKTAWWRAGDAARPLSTPETATGLGALGRVRLLESPHTSDNYLLKEMGFRVARKHARKLRLIAMGLGGLAPVLLASLAPVAPIFFLTLALAAHIAGMLTERWLFFAEARHAQMTFYDRREPAESLA